MQSSIKLHLAAAQPAALSFDALCSTARLPLRSATVDHYVLNCGHIHVQSLSHYHAHIQLFDYVVNEDTKVDFSIADPAFFMHADLNKNSCYLCYRSAGNYRKTVPKGENQILLITFRPDWLVYKCQKLSELKVFTTAICNQEMGQGSLPAIGIGKSLFTAIKKMNTNGDELNDEGYHFISGCINKYYNQLKCRNSSSHYRHFKAAEIAAFIRLNFTSELAENLPKLAARFMVSERTMARLAEIAFGMPLHKQVIKLRMGYALDLLINTDKPIFEIAALSGYKESYYFSKAFKKYYGECPKCVKRPCRRAARIKMETAFTVQ